MKILVLGNANSRWIKEFVQYVLLPLKNEVTVVLPKKETLNYQFYLNCGVKIKTEYGPRLIIKKIPFFRIFDSANQIYKNNIWEEYDYIINLFVNHRDLSLSQKVSKNGKNIILYYCGSDVFRKSNLALRINKLLVNKPYCVCVGSQALYNALTHRIPTYINPHIIRFGISVLDEIDKIRFLERNSKYIKDTVFCIGYNGAREQQHLEVIKVFARLAEEKKKRISLIIPMTYRRNESYKNEVVEMLNNTGIHFTLLTEFMDNQQMAEMWSRIGYFINAQTTDSLSASVLESIYAGCTLINGSWLNYPEYEEFNLKYYEFDTFETLFSMLNSILDGSLNSINQIDLSNIYDEMSWKRAEKKWQGLLT